MENLYCVAIAAVNYGTGRAEALALSIAAKSEDEARQIGRMEAIEEFPALSYGPVSVSICTTQQQGVNGNG